MKDRSLQLLSSRLHQRESDKSCSLTLIVTSKRGGLL